MMDGSANHIDVVSPKKTMKTIVKTLVTYTISVLLLTFRTNLVAKIHNIYIEIVYIFNISFHS